MNLLTQDLQPEPSYRLIALTRGQFAKVDAADFEWLSQWKWYAKFSLTANKFYANRCQHNPKKTIQMHRLIMGDPSGLQIDHRDTDTLNNCRSNLRVATNAENQRNKHIAKRNASGLKGVSWVKRKRKWEARIQINRKTYRLGRFSTPELAHAAYIDAAKIYHGEFARW